MTDLLNAGAHGVIVIIFLIEMHHVLRLEQRISVLERKLQKCIDTINRQKS